MSRRRHKKRNKVDNQIHYPIQHTELVKGYICEIRQLSDDEAMIECEVMKNNALYGLKTKDIFLKTGDVDISYSLPCGNGWRIGIDLVAGFDCPAPITYDAAYAKLQELCEVCSKYD